MTAPHSFIVKPKENRYKSPKQLGDISIDRVSSIEDAKDVSKSGIVVSLPKNYNGEIEVGDEVIIHHNIFRMYYDVKGKLKYSRAYLYENRYQVIPEELFLYKKNGEWKANEDFCFVKPIEEDTISFLKGKKLPHSGKIVISNNHPVGEEIGFTPESEYPVEVNGEVLYRMRDKDIAIYERFS